MRSLNPQPSEGVSEEEVSAEEAFERFVSERYGRVRSAVRTIVGDTATAEDVTQEAFARAYLHWAKLWPSGKPAAWVHRVSTNLAISLRRRTARELRAIARLSRRTEATITHPDPHPELHRAVRALPPRQRAAVALHYAAGLSMEEAAEAMKCRPGTVKSLLHNARERLRKELGEP